MQRIHRIIDTIQHELWPLPILGIAIGLLLGLGLPALDAALPEARGLVSSGVFGGSPEAARAILTTITGSVVTVTTLTFSMTIVLLQLASTQYTPRLLRTFTGDTVVHVTLAVFLGTFAYSLAVLRTVRSSTADHDAFVPAISVSFAFVLAIAVVVLLVVFLTHITRNIRLETILADVAAEGRSALARAYRNSRPGLPPIPDHPAEPIPSSGTGFVGHVETEALAGLAAERGWVISFEITPGDFVTTNQTLARVRNTASPHHLTADDVGLLVSRVNAAVIVGRERTTVQDPRFPIQQIVDIYNRALSPGVNDSTTALHCLNYLGSLLGAIAGSDVRHALECDDGGTVRVFMPRPTFTELASLILHDAVAFGRDQVAIVDKSFAMLREASLCDTSRRYTAEIEALVDDLAAMVPLGDFSPRDAEQLRFSIDAARRAAVSAAGHPHLIADFRS
ncbi:DUF2254 domain-containing protein [Zhihengliuella halotolerans]|uniref:Putative membrane protein n=1 Tax=Zhihengliuella halotolerans TaxID=370736 RepID=A0A4Q8AFV9_9MICC|nr:DUF2254 domain-containing protein [Zhihengliuella halotolerans]RZU63220.1 putative membrane protein [Zhihengliuella halotolerans]